MSSCDSSKPDEEREAKIDFTAEELQSIFDEHKEEFNYVVDVASYLSPQFRIRFNDNKIGFYISKDYDIEDRPTYDDGGGLVYINSYYSYSEDGSEVGYKKDEMFEQCLRTLLIDNQLESFYKDPSTMCFGSNFLIRYNTNPKKYEHITKNGKFEGKLADNWYYFVWIPFE
jgi:hypothetical protein